MEDGTGRQDEGRDGEVVLDFLYCWRVEDKDSAVGGFMSIAFGMNEPACPDHALEGHSISKANVMDADPAPSIFDGLIVTILVERRRLIGAVMVRIVAIFLSEVERTAFISDSVKLIAADLI